MPQIFLTLPLEDVLMLQQVLAAVQKQTVGTVVSPFCERLNERLNLAVNTFQQLLRE